MYHCYVVPVFENYTLIITRLLLLYFLGLAPSFGWKGPEAVFCESFDDTDGLVLKEGLNQADTFPLVFGKVRTQQ